MSDDRSGEVKDSEEHRDKANESLYSIGVEWTREGIEDTLSTVGLVVAYNTAVRRHQCPGSTNP